jgi:hypothetical protein
MTPAAFALLVIKQFYPGKWASCPTKKVGQHDRTIDELMIAERQDCRILANDFFSEAAARQFYIS